MGSIAALTQTASGVSAGRVRHWMPARSRMGSRSVQVRVRAIRNRAAPLASTKAAAACRSVAAAFHTSTCAATGKKAPGDCSRGLPSTREPASRGSDACSASADARPVEWHTTPQWASPRVIAALASVALDRYAIDATSGNGYLVGWQLLIEPGTRDKGGSALWAQSSASRVSFAVLKRGSPSECTAPSALMQQTGSAENSKTLHAVATMVRDAPHQA